MRPEVYSSAQIVCSHRYLIRFAQPPLCGARAPFPLLKPADFRQKRTSSKMSRISPMPFSRRIRRAKSGDFSPFLDRGPNFPHRGPKIAPRGAQRRNSPAPVTSTARRLQPRRHLPCTGETAMQGSLHSRRLSERFGEKRCTGRWSGRRASNPRPSPWQGDALPLSHTR